MLCILRNYERINVTNMPYISLTLYNRYNIMYNTQKQDLQKSQVLNN